MSLRGKRDEAVTTNLWNAKFFTCPKSFVCTNGNLILRGQDWKRQVANCLERDNYACKQCGSRFALDAHHILKKSQGGSDNLENLTTLCRKCHNEQHMQVKLSSIPLEAEP